MKNNEEKTDRVVGSMSEFIDKVLEEKPKIVEQMAEVIVDKKLHVVTINLETDGIKTKAGSVTVPYELILAIAGIIAKDIEKDG